MFNMEKYMFSKCAILLVICSCIIALSNAKLSSAEAKTLNRKFEFRNSELQNKLSNAFFEIQELRDRSTTCECQQQINAGKSL